MKLPETYYDRNALRPVTFLNIVPGPKHLKPGPGTMTMFRFSKMDAIGCKTDHLSNAKLPLAVRRAA